MVAKQFVSLFIIGKLLLRIRQLISFANVFLLVPMDPVSKFF